MAFRVGHFGIFFVWKGTRDLERFMWLTRKSGRGPFSNCMIPFGFYKFSLSKNFPRQQADTESCISFCIRNVQSLLEINLDLTLTLLKSLSHPIPARWANGTGRAGQGPFFLKPVVAPSAILLWFIGFKILGRWCWSGPWGSSIWDHALLLDRLPSFMVPHFHPMQCTPFVLLPQISPACHYPNFRILFLGQRRRLNHGHNQTRTHSRD